MNASEGDLRRAGGGDEEAGVVRAEAVEGLGRFSGMLGRREGGTDGGRERFCGGATRFVWLRGCVRRDGGGRKREVGEELG